MMVCGRGRSMMNRKLIFFLFLFGIVFFAVAQESEESPSPRRRQSPSPAGSEADLPSLVVVINETGFTVKNVFISRVNDDNWGNNFLVNLLYNKESVTINMNQTPEGNNLYKIRLVDVDGDFYTKTNITLRERTTIRMRISDFEWDK